MNTKQDQSDAQEDVQSHWRQQALERMRQDFYLALVSLFGLFAAVIILPFAVWRFITGQWVGGFGDLGLISLLAALVIYAWWSGRARLACTLLAWAVTAGYLTLIGLGASSVMWTFPVIVASFLLADRYSAVLASVAALLFVSFASNRLEGGFELASFLASGMLVAVFGLLFSHRNAAQQHQLTMAAERDPLTGTGNRRALRVALDHFVNPASRPFGDVALIVMDLDYFKAVNDRFGHDKGDEILISFTRLVTENLRQNDQLFRMGGEEFVALLPGTGRDGAVVAANKVLTVVRSELKAGSEAVTVSAGVAELADESANEWLSRADRALYQAKEAGRDQVKAVD